MADNTIHGRRNLIINGAFQIAQRATSATNPGGGYDTVDRWRSSQANGGLGNYNAEQSADTPNGFSHSYKLTNSNAVTQSSNVNAFIEQRLEGQNLQQLSYGSSSAKKLTASFYVKSSVIGTYGVTLGDGEQGRHNVQTFTISSANTWEEKTLTFSGDTSVALANDNTSEFMFAIILGAGTDYQTSSTNTWTNGHKLTTSSQTQWKQTNGATFFITGVQLEVGSQATPFEHASSFGEQLALCQRYYYHTYSYGTPAGTTFNQDYESPIIIIGTGNHGMGVCNGVYPVEMRAAPTLSFYSSDGTANKIRHWGGAHASYGTVNRSTRQILGMSFNAGTNTEDFYSAALVCDAEL